MKKLDIPNYEPNGEFSSENWESLHSAIVSEVVEKKKKAQKVKNEVKMPMNADFNELEANSQNNTYEIRLSNARNDYNFNQSLIKRFQDEIKQAQSLLKDAGNGGVGIISQVSQLEKYQKLNIALNKLISDLESDLDLRSVKDEEESVFK